MFTSRVTVPYGVVVLSGKFMVEWLNRVLVWHEDHVYEQGRGPLRGDGAASWRHD